MFKSNSQTSSSPTSTALVRHQRTSIEAPSKGKIIAMMKADGVPYKHLLKPTPNLVFSPLLSHLSNPSVGGGGGQASEFKHDTKNCNLLTNNNEEQNEKTRKVEDRAHQECHQTKSQAWKSYTETRVMCRITRPFLKNFLFVLAIFIVLRSFNEYISLYVYSHD